MNAKAIILTLREKIIQDCQEDVFREYMATVLRLGVENLAKMSNGSFVKIEFRDLIRPKKEETRTSDDIIKFIKMKINTEEEKNRGGEDK